jgi:hypothetical protein
VTRLLRGHPPIAVDLGPDGQVAAITLGNRRERVEVCNRWRVEESWWRDPIARDYFKIVGERWLALIYYDRVAGTWHLERLYD